MSISYTTLATIIWLIVAILVGLNITVFFFWPPRYAVFTVAAAMGVVLLLRVNLRVHKKNRQGPPKQLSSGAPTLLPAPASETVKKELLASSAPTISTSVVASPAASQKLSPTNLAAEALAKEAAREWLDDFLVKQQKSK